MAWSLDDFDFDLAPERIALEPVRPREAARLMNVEAGSISDRRVGDLPEILKPGDLLIVNDSRVIRARIDGQRPPRAERGAATDSVGVRIQANLIRRLDKATFDALVRPAKRLRAGDQIFFDGGLSAVVAARSEGGEVRLRFDKVGADLDAHLEQFGQMPLPPYIAARRSLRPQDDQDYQTVYARSDGSVAAPTAGLHFSEALLSALKSRNIETAAVTLHVGAGTFLPVKTQHIEDHKMHSEWGCVPAETAQKIADTRAAGGRIVAVGTTALRLLESAVDSAGIVRAFSGETDIFIRPGHIIRSADLLLTNFHLPRSTLLMLVAAFAGYDTMRQGYAHAVEGGYRFFSYGDCSLWTRVST